jgi:hypothetical protein
MSPSSLQNLFLTDNVSHHLKTTYGRRQMEYVLSNTPIYKQPFKLRIFFWINLIMTLFRHLVSSVTSRRGTNEEMIIAEKRLNEH